jgi:uncharacterized protein YbjT (DUF2867 family)
MNKRILLAFCVMLLGSALLPAPAAAKGELVAVAGASGRTGKHVVEQLAASGYKVRALVRDVDKAKGMFPAGVTIVAADVRDVASLRAALKGARYVVSSIGAGGTGQIEAGNGPEEIDNLGVANLAKVAKAARVKQVVLVSSSAVTKHVDYPVAFMRPILFAKLKGEDALRASGVPYTIVRPGGLIDEPGGRLPVAFAQGDQTTGRIPLADVATVCLAALGRKSAMGKTFEIFSAKEGAANDWVRDFAALSVDKAKP